MDFSSESINIPWSVVQANGVAHQVHPGPTTVILLSISRSKGGGGRALIGFNTTANMTRVNNGFMMKASNRETVAFPTD
jgi:hypothetical protein